MSEESLWKYLRDKLFPPDIHATRIENGVSSGFPDVHYTFKPYLRSTQSGTMELKFLRKKNPPFGKNGLNKDQEWWIRDEVKAGGKVWIVAGIADKIYFIPGRFYDRFNKFSLSDFEEFSALTITKKHVTADDLISLKYLL
jgi:hypothetical protein